jgi:hypothetical protein
MTTALSIIHNRLAIPHCHCSLYNLSNWHNVIKYSKKLSWNAGRSAHSTPSKCSFKLEILTSVRTQIVFTASQSSHHGRYTHAMSFIPLQGYGSCSTHEDIDGCPRYHKNPDSFLLINGRQLPLEGQFGSLVLERSQNPFPRQAMPVRLCVLFKNQSTCINNRFSYCGQRQHFTEAN